MLLLQEVEVRQAVQGEQQGHNVLPHLASPGDLLLDNVGGSQAMSVLVQQPTYQVQLFNGTAEWFHMRVIDSLARPFKSHTVLATQQQALVLHLSEQHL